MITGEDLKNPHEFAAVAASYFENALDQGVSERTVHSHRLFMLISAIIVALILGICTIPSVNTQMGSVVFASGGWLSLSMSLLLAYSSLSYFFQYWCDRTAYGFRKGRLSAEDRTSRLSANATEHLLRSNVPGLTAEEKHAELEIHEAKSRLLREIGSKLRLSTYLMWIIYLLIPAVMLAVSVYSLVAAAPWDFAAIPPAC